MNKRKLRYARQKTKERILRQRSRQAFQGQRQENLQLQQEENERTPESYAEEHIERYSRGYADRTRMQGKKLLVQKRETQVHISSVLQEKGFVDRKYGIPLFNRKWKATGPAGVKTASRIARGTKREISTLLTGGSILLLLLAVILPLCAAAALFGSDVEGEIPSDDILVAIAQSQTGNEGGEPYWRWYGFDQHVDWCAIFVSWCADQAGLLETGDLPRYAVCDDGIHWFIKKGRWYRNTIKPQPDMIIFFDWDKDGRAEHTGIVEKCENGLVCTIEGNSHDVCQRKWYAAGDRVIMGYGAGG